jgi:hypothetical protein
MLCVHRSGTADPWPPLKRRHRCEVVGALEVRVSIWTRCSSPVPTWQELSHRAAPAPFLKRSSRSGSGFERCAAPPGPERGATAPEFAKRAIVAPAQPVLTGGASRDKNAEGKVRRGRRQRGAGQSMARRHDGQCLAAGVCCSTKGRCRTASLSYDRQLEAA